MVCTILVPVTGHRECEPAIDAALLMARRFEAHLVGLHIKGNPLGKLPFIDESLAQRDIAREFENLRRNILYTEEGARAQFETSRVRHDVPLAEAPGPKSSATASFQITARRSANTLSETARIYDLVVMPAAGTIADEDAVQALEGVLFGSGRPVLVAPSMVAKTIGTELFVAWNRSAQSARAVSAATNFIDTASKITIGYVSTGAKAGPTPEELASSLAWSGIKADLCHIEPTGTPVGELLLTHAENLGTDLMIMGAYSHSRLRDIILGGVTRHILRNASLPVLMVH